MLLSIENKLADLPETLNSYTSSSIVTGADTIPVRNISSFQNEYAIQIGKTGEEQSEITVISTPSGTALTLNSGTLLYDHPLDTPVYNIHFDQIVIERSTAGTSGTATPLATVSITPDSKYTQYDDTTGISTYAYKTYYQNSVSSDVSSESDWFTPSGPSYYSLQKVRQRIKDVLYNSNYLKSDDVINDWINEWLEQMNNAAIKVNKAYSMGTASYAFGTAGYGTITESGFKQANKIEFTFDGTNYINTSGEVPMSAYSESDRFSSIYPKHSWTGDTTFRVLPFGVAGTARFSFGKLITPLENDTDEIPTVFRAYTTSCINYGLYRAYENDTESELSKSKLSEFKQSKDEFVSEITPRDQTGIKTIDIVESLSGMNEDVGSDFIL